MFGAVLIIFEAFDLENQSHAIDQAHQEIGRVAMVHAEIIVWNRKLQMIVAGVKGNCVFRLLQTS